MKAVYQVLHGIGYLVWCMERSSIPYTQILHTFLMHATHIVLAAGHAGFPLKEVIKKYLEEQQITVTDVGTFSEDTVDYPEIIRKGCAIVLERGIPGIIFGGSGNGEAIAANKVRGIRAALCYNEESVRLAPKLITFALLCARAKRTDSSL